MRRCSLIPPTKYRTTANINSINSIRILTYIELFMFLQTDFWDLVMRQKRNLPLFPPLYIKTDAARVRVFCQSLSQKVFRRGSFAKNLSLKVFRQLSFVKSFSSSIRQSFVIHSWTFIHWLFVNLVFTFHYSLIIRLITVLFWISIFHTYN